MVDEAIEIAREGLRVHPHFIGGRVALARALFEKKAYEEVITELGAVIQDVPDNLVAQRLFAESALMLGKVTDALTAYKMLLYYSPSDSDTAKLVEELETQSYERGQLVLRKDVPASDADGFSVGAGAAGALDGSPEHQRARWIGQIERLQTWLQRVERYRAEG